MSNLTRRAAIAGAAALPLAPAAAAVPLGTPANATDAAWATLQAARAHHNAERARLGSISDDVADVIIDPMIDAENAVTDIPAATMTDIERKASIYAEMDSEMTDLLADLRRVMGGVS